MSRIEPYKQSEPRVAMTPFGLVMVPGPFADDYTRLKWNFHDHRDGESARFRVAGLEAFVQDCDGDASWWQIKDIRTGKIRRSLNAQPRTRATALGYGRAGNRHAD